MSNNSNIPLNLPLPPPTPRKLAYNFAEACEILSVSKSTWTRLIKSGEIRPLNGHNIVALSELERYVRIHTKQRTIKKKRKPHED